MFETVKEFSKIIFTAKKSRMIVFLLIIFLSVNGIHSFWAGQPAEQGQFNYVVSIRKLNSHLCTGTIIDETHVLTVAHLLLGAYRGELSVVAGTVKIVPESVHRIKVKKIYVHPLLKKLDISGSLGEDWEHDIAIIELHERFQWSIDYGLAPRTTVQFGWLTCPICTMITWTYDSTKLTQMWDIVSRLNPKSCVKDHIHVGKNQQCFIDETNELIILSEDLGGPIVCDNTMIGFVAKEQAVGNRIAGLSSTFLETAAYSEFIHNVLISALAFSNIPCRKGLVDVRLQEFPYVVSIWCDNSYICSGSILDETHILTAAKCIEEKDKAQLKVVAGFREISEAHAVLSQLSVHDIKTNNDIAILVLARPIPFELYFKQLNYLNTEDVSPGLFCELLLWKDDLDTSVVKPKKLRKARVRISTKRICKKFIQSQGLPITEGQFCARNQYAIKVADFGDSGSPLIYENKLIGILVKTPPLHGQIVEALFLDIHPYKEFIRSTITAEETTVTTPEDLISFDSN